MPVLRPMALLATTAGLSACHLASYPYSGERPPIQDTLTHPEPGPGDHLRARVLISGNRPFVEITDIPWGLARE